MLAHSLARHSEGDLQHFCEQLHKTGPHGDQGQRLNEAIEEESCLEREEVA